MKKFFICMLDMVSGTEKVKRAREDPYAYDGPFINFPQPSNT